MAKNQIKLKVTKPMTERQVKIRMTKVGKLIDELEMLKDNDMGDTEHTNDIKAKINKIYDELLKEKHLPIAPAFIYDTESGAYTTFEEARLNNGKERN